LRALVSSTTSLHAELVDAPDPHPDRNQALVEVKAFSLNRGETKRLASMKPGSARAASGPAGAFGVVG